MQQDLDTSGIDAITTASLAIRQLSSGNYGPIIRHRRQGTMLAQRYSRLALGVILAMPTIGDLLDPIPKHLDNNNPKLAYARMKHAQNASRHGKGKKATKRW